MSGNDGSGGETSKRGTGTVAPLPSGSEPEPLASATMATDSGSPVDNSSINQPISSSFESSVFGGGRLPRLTDGGGNEVPIGGTGGNEVPIGGTGGAMAVRSNGQASSNSFEASRVAVTPRTNTQSDLHDDASSSDDNMHDASNSSSVHVTPKSKQLRFLSRKVARAPSPGHAGVETSVLSCELALLNALSNDMESSVDRLDRDQWRTRIAQINQVVRMVQWEAHGLYEL